MEKVCNALLPLTDLIPKGFYVEKVCNALPPLADVIPNYPYLRSNQNNYF